METLIDQIIIDVYQSDIEKLLKEVGINPTKENVQKYHDHAEHIRQKLNETLKNELSFFMKKIKEEEFPYENAED